MLTESAMPRKCVLCRVLLVCSLNRIASTSPTAATTPEQPSCGTALPREGFHQYRLLSSVAVSEDTKLLRFALPDGMPTLGLPLPSCLKIKLELDEHVLLDKSYSPISLPDQTDYVELLVKGYPPRAADHPWQHGAPGGLGAFLINLEVGQTADLKLKAPRIIHGEQYFTNRWAEVGLVAGGTGIAPFVQIIRAVLADPAEQTRLSLVFANRNLEDILLKDELDGYAATQPDRFRVHYILSSPPDGSWTGGTGWVSILS